MKKNKITSKAFLILLSTMICMSAKGAVDENIMIKGEIYSSDQKEYVVVKDSFSQKIKVPRKVFPKKFDFRKGNQVSVQVLEIDFDKLNPPPKTKTNEQN